MATEVQSPASRIVSRNPANGEKLREAVAAGEKEVCEAVMRARSAQASWQLLDVSGRIRVLRKFQQLLVRNKGEVARLITQEAGKPYVEALLTEVLVVLDAARFLTEHAGRLLRDPAVAHGNMVMKAKSGRLLREPYGVVGIISPWNYPFSIPATESLAALVAGNAVILKPSEFTSLCSLRLGELFSAAGLPPDVFQVLVGDGATGAALIHSAIDKLIFTGSVATGKRVAAAAAVRLLPLVLELGGKDPMLVLEDADVDVATSGAVWGAFANAGQACLSVERCYVHRSLYDRFLQACQDKVSKLRVGAGEDPEIDVGPLIHERQLSVVESHVEDAKQLGARVLCGGRRLSELGPNFYAPTVLAEVTHGMRIMREETFGPVLPIMAFDSDQEAVLLANDSEYGLSASIWTGSRRRGEALARKIHAGTIMINDVMSCFGISEAPHGGMKASGLGRTHGQFGLEEMVRLKYLDSDLMPHTKKLWWYRYGKAFTHQMEGFLDTMFAATVGDRFRGGLRSLKSLLAGKGRL